MCTFFVALKKCVSQAWEFTPVIPALGRQRQGRSWAQGQPVLQSKILVTQSWLILSLCSCLFIWTSGNHQMRQAGWEWGRVWDNVCLTKRYPYATHRHTKKCTGENVSDKTLQVVEQKSGSVVIFPRQTEGQMLGSGICKGRGGQVKSHMSWANLLHF
jgi:hypothetical protein